MDHAEWELALPLIQLLREAFVELRVPAGFADEVVIFNVSFGSVEGGSGGSLRGDGKLRITSVDSGCCPLLSSTRVILMTSLLFTAGPKVH